MKPKKCKQCSEYFEPTRPLQMVCSPLCAIAYKNKQEAKEVEGKKGKDEGRTKDLN
jgi:hypothetical protein